MRRRSTSISTARQGANRSGSPVERRVLRPCRPPWAGFYVNDMNLFGPSLAGQPAGAVARRADRDAARRRLPTSTCAIAKGKMIPLRSLVASVRTRGHRPPALITRYNNVSGRDGARAPLRTGHLVGAGAQGRDGGGRPPSTLPQGFAGEWTDTAYPGKARRVGKTGDHSRRSPCCSRTCSWWALYESWTIPVPVLLSVADRRCSAIVRRHHGRCRD